MKASGFTRRRLLAKKAQEKESDFAPTEGGTASGILLQPARRGERNNCCPKWQR
jgi:hypothetical protein